MTEILTKDEIEQLLNAISGVGKSFNNIEEFEEYLTARKFDPENLYGLRTTDVSMCRFFNTKNNDNILADIKKKNEEQGLGNIRIPDTNITLINYSICPKCNLIFSFKEILDYYKKPMPDISYNDIFHQFRKDTRVFCFNCNTYFLPSLVISDGTPKNEVQFLCRIQTIDAVEEYMSSKNTKVLTKKKCNIVHKNGLRAIKNDVSIMELEERPTLITNIIQYTPINLIMNFIDGTNIEKDDLLFGEWKKAS